MAQFRNFIIIIVTVYLCSSNTLSKKWLKRHLSLVITSGHNVLDLEIRVRTRARAQAPGINDR